MRYLLVLQWSATSAADYDAMLEIEAELEEKLSPSHEVDGHDAGSGETNIFIVTENPEAAFTEIRHLIGDRTSWIDCRIAYREDTGEKYTILWPRNLVEFDVA